MAGTRCARSSRGCIRSHPVITCLRLTDTSSSISIDGLESNYFHDMMIRKGTLPSTECAISMRSPRSSKHSWGAQFFAKDIAKRIVTLFGSGLTDREQLKNALLAMFPPSEEDGRLPSRIDGHGSPSAPMCIAAGGC